MLHQPTLEKLEAMRLHGMAQAWRQLAKSERASDLSFEEHMALVVDRQFAWRQNEASRFDCVVPTPAPRTFIIVPRVGCNFREAVVCAPRSEQVTNAGNTMPATSEWHRIALLSPLNEQAQLTLILQGIHRTVD